MLQQDKQMQLPSKLWRVSAVSPFHCHQNIQGQGLDDENPRQKLHSPPNHASLPRRISLLGEKNIKQFLCTHVPHDQTGPHKNETNATCPSKYEDEALDSRQLNKTKVEPKRKKKGKESELHGSTHDKRWWIE